MRQQIEGTKDRDAPHDLLYFNGKVRCHACCQSSLCERGRHLQWTVRQCPANPAADRLAAIGAHGFGLTVGNLQAHISHKLRHVRGIAYCTMCGAFVSSATTRRSSMKGLAVLCQRVPTRSAKVVLNRLARGQPPTTRDDWPEPGDV